MENYLRHKRDLNRKRVKKCYFNKVAKKQRPSTPSSSESDNGCSNTCLDDGLTTLNSKPLFNFDHLKELYPGSDVKYGEFIKILVTLLEQMHCSNVIKDRLIKFIRAILPRDNQCPKSYYLLKEELAQGQLNLTKRQYVCVCCNKKILKGQICYDPVCQHFRNQKVNQTRIDPYYVANNYVSHFQRIINKNWNLILEYKKEMATHSAISDLCNANALKSSKEISHNSIAIIIFVDEAEMTPSSKANNVYVVLGLIMNLPLRARSSYFNIINFMFWGGYIVNFNNLFQYFEPHLDEFFNQLILINSHLTVRVHLLGVIGDGLGRAKALNISQHNGYCSCFKCLQPGEREIGSNSTKFKYDPAAEIRTHQMYNAQVEVAVRTKKPYKGIKDFTFFSKYVELPMGEIVDPLHLIYEGTFKSMLNDWFDSRNHMSTFYLGSVRSHAKINSILRFVKFPSDYPRAQREVQHFSYCTANEHKHFMLNVSIYVLEELLPSNYFEHLCTYIAFVRLLTKPSISIQDITSASELINEFVKAFSILYGSDKMTHNLHLHLHLPLQVFHFGGLDMLNAFPLEGYFKICRLMFHGTKSICETIKQNIALKHLIVFSDKFDIQNPRLDILYKNMSNRRYVDETYIINPILTQIEKLPLSERQAIISLNGSSEISILFGTKAIIKGIGIFCCNILIYWML